LHQQTERFAQSHDFLKSSLDQIAVFLHQSVNAVNVVKDIQEYISKTATGKESGPYCEYVPLYSQILGGEYTPAGSSETKEPHLSPVPQYQTLPPPQFVPQQPVVPQQALAPSAPTSPQSPGEDKAGEPLAQGLYDFESTEPDELPFKAGDVIKIYTSPPDNDWWQGELNGRVGIFPKDYVQLMAGPTEGGPMPTPSPVAIEPPAPTTNTAAVDAMAAAAAAATGGAADALKLMDATCEAMYDFEAQGADELSFKLGDVLIITGELNGWYLGKSKDGSRVGIFPSNYVAVKPAQ